MTKAAIEVKGLSKHYRLGQGPQGKGDLRDTVAAAATRVRGRFRRPADGSEGLDADASVSKASRDLWALKDITFDVQRGEVLGLIGHNGAGKSTLLKILSRITDPTEGEAFIHGRMGSLLEVGTGFHPELTGRENVFLNGAVLGMSRREVSDKFDEIVEFSEIGRFIDTPVKRYSSGMYVRLAFAVASNLEPEILVVDEVLAVGDAAFQKKCIAKMRSFADEGRTILFVSHNMGSIQSLCDRAVVLQKGRLIGGGTPAEAVKMYLAENAVEAADLAERTDREGHQKSRVTSLRAWAGDNADAPGYLLYGEPATIRVGLSAVTRGLSCILAIYDGYNRPVCRFASKATVPADTATGEAAFLCEIPELPLTPGGYHLNVTLHDRDGLADSIQQAAEVTIEQGLMAGRALAQPQLECPVAPRHAWAVPDGSA